MGLIVDSSSTQELLRKSSRLCPRPAESELEFEHEPHRTCARIPWCEKVLVLLSQDKVLRGSFDKKANMEFNPRGQGRLP